MLASWIDDLAVLYWPWRVKDGITFPPAQRRRRDHRSGNQRDEDESSAGSASQASPHSRHT